MKDSVGQMMPKGVPVLKGRGKQMSCSRQDDEQMDALQTGYDLNSNRVDI